MHPGTKVDGALPNASAIASAIAQLHRMLARTGRLCYQLKCWLRQKPTGFMSSFFKGMGWMMAALNCCLAVPSSAASSVARLNGSFVQYWDEMQTWSPAVWQGILEKMQELRMDTVVIQMLVRENSDGALHSFIGPSGEPDATETILRFADTNGFRVFLGLYLPNWNHDLLASNFLYETQTRMADVATQAWTRYLSGNRHPSFAGWYLPYEPWTANYSAAEINRLRSFFQGVSQACHLVSGDVPLAISPFINSSRPPPCDVERVYTQLLDKTGIGIVMLQDSVGAQQWESHIIQHVSPYAQAFQRACAATGVELWANLECFAIEGSAYMPCTASRLRNQFEATAPFVQRFVTFDFVHYMNPVAFLSSWNLEKRSRMQQLFADYKAAFVDQDFAPWGSPLISANVSAGNLTLRWPGASGDLFEVQWKTNLADAAWEPLAANVATQGTMFSVVEEVTPQPHARFFRVQRLPRLQPLAEMVWIPPGTFQMGTPASDPGKTPDELPRLTVTLTRGFWISRHEVTQSEYQNLMCTNLSSFAGDLNCPAERVSWNDAMEYFSRLAQQERRAGRLPDTHTYRLPSEAEWEYAARAGTTNWFSFGDDPSLLGSYAWYNANSSATTHPVGGRLPNPWGLADIHGNVFEWCWDWISSAPNEPATDLLGSTNGAYRAIRGGAWSFPATYCRSSWRMGYPPGARTSNVGFRIVLAPVAH